MRETMPQQNHEPRLPKWPVHKMSLEERADTSELKGLLAKLKQDTKNIKDRLGTAYGTAPSDQQIEHAREAIEDARTIKYHNVVKEVWKSEPPPSLISIAMDARAFGRHHGGYHVGAALLGLRMDAAPHENPWEVFFNANTKVHTTGEAIKIVDGKEVDKWCAEQYLLDEARARKIKIVCLVVAAEPREIKGVSESFKDDESGVEQITLTPCEKCRARLEKCMHPSEEGPAIVDPKTEIYTVNVQDPTKLIEKIFPAEHLKDFHGSGRPPQKSVI